MRAPGVSKAEQLKPHSTRLSTARVFSTQVIGMTAIDECGCLAWPPDKDGKKPCVTTLIISLQMAI